MKYKVEFSYGGEPRFQSGESTANYSSGDKGQIPLRDFIGFLIHQHLIDNNLHKDGLVAQNILFYKQEGDTYEELFRLNNLWQSPILPLTFTI